MHAHTDTKENDEGTPDVGARNELVPQQAKAILFKGEKERERESGQKTKRGEEREEERKSQCSRLVAAAAEAEAGSAPAPVAGRKRGGDSEWALAREGASPSEVLRVFS